MPPLFPIILIYLLSYFLPQAVIPQGMGIATPVVFTHKIIPNVFRIPLAIAVPPFDANIGNQISYNGALVAIILPICPLKFPGIVVVIKNDRFTTPFLTKYPEKSLLNTNPFAPCGLKTVFGSSNPFGNETFPDEVIDMPVLSSFVITTEPSLAVLKYPPP